MRRSVRRAVAAAGLAAATFAAVPGRAAEYLVAVTPAAPGDFTGATLHFFGPPTGGDLLVTKITGTSDGHAATRVDDTYGFPDNILYLSTPATPFSYSGVSFDTDEGVAGAPRTYNLYYDAAGAQGAGTYELDDAAAGATLVAVQISFAGNSVPEPAAWTLMLAGFAAVGTRLRRGSRRVKGANGAG